MLTMYKSALNIGIGVARVLVTTDCNKPWVPIRILNPDTMKKHLLLGTCIASVERLNVTDHITEPEKLPLTVNSTTISRKARFQPPKEFSDLFDLSKSTFNSETVNELLCLLCNYSDAFLKIFIYLFGVLCRFQHCTGHITTGSWKGRGNQYIQLVRVMYYKLPTNGKQLPAFPLETVPGTEPQPQRWEARVLPLCHRGPCIS